MFRSLFVYFVVGEEHGKTAVSAVTVLMISFAKDTKHNYIMKSWARFYLASLSQARLDMQEFVIDIELFNELIHTNVKTDRAVLNSNSVCIKNFTTAGGRWVVELHGLFCDLLYRRDISITPLTGD